jgi:deoxyribodipyrimidine photo-lyase
MPNTEIEKRSRVLGESGARAGGRCVVYLMSRDQRVEDNWALLAAAERARHTNLPLVVLFHLYSNLAVASTEHFEFMLAGLHEVEQILVLKHIPFVVVTDEKGPVLYLRELQPHAVFVDFSPLRHARALRSALTNQLDCPVIEVDTHNVIPAWILSEKQEFAAYTIRPKVHTLLDAYLTEIPVVEAQLPSQRELATDLPLPKPDWSALRASLATTSNNQQLRFVPGTIAAHHLLQKFITRLHQYDQSRNDPNAHAQSDLSPYLHFGQISAQRVALAVQQAYREQSGQMDDARLGQLRLSKDAFLEELIVRRELAENYCFYNPEYDNPSGYPPWAQQTHALHAGDQREFVYSLDEFEAVGTHDPLWNAAQTQLSRAGKMHGYLRMYWAKKILEWTESVAEAQKVAIYLNDRYSLDGRDPNGYAGIAWSLGGVHDRAWFDRPIFGKIRYMNYNGAQRKFDVSAYIKNWS